MSERKPRIQRENISPTTSVILISQGDSLSMVLRDDEAGAIMHELDALLHLWGEPGVVPTGPGEYLWQWQTPGEPNAWERATPVNVETDVLSGELCLSHLGGRYDEEQFALLSGNKAVRFRKRWTPAAP